MVRRSGGGAYDELQAAEVVGAHVEDAVAEPQGGDGAQEHAGAGVFDDEVGLVWGHDAVDGERRPVRSTADA